VRVVVLGAGVVGVTTAYFLAKAGDEVTVVERRPGVALDTSFANAGLVSPGHSYTWASPQAPWILLKSLFREGQSLKFKLLPDWRLYAWGLRFLRNCTEARAYLNTSRKVRLCLYSQAQLQAVTRDEGLSYGQTSKGLLYLHREQASLDRAAAAMAVLEDNGLRLVVLDARAVMAKEPALGIPPNCLAGAIYCPSDGSGDAHLFTRELYGRCLALGVRFRFNTDVRGICTEGDEVTHVDTTDGPIPGDGFVVATGAYSPALARAIGYRLPIYPVKGYSMTLPVSEGHRPPEIGGIDEHSLLAWARFGNRLRFTATAEFAGFDTRHQPSDFGHMTAAARALFPDGADFDSPTYWAGLRPMTPNGTPILGRGRHRNLFLNVGHGHLGWTMSCGTARLTSDVMHGRPPDIDMTGLTLAGGSAA
jgi:D-amino-acid dehydrogenase